MDDQEKRDHIAKSLRIVSKVEYPDGSYIGAGFLDDPQFKSHDIGVIMVDSHGIQKLAFEMNAQNLLILTQVISVTIRKQIEENEKYTIKP